MVCRHSAGDPNCSKNQYIVYVDRDIKSPDSSNYEIIESEQIGNHLVMKVLYPNCKKCSYEGNKVMVFLNTTALEALKWRKIDPHFRAESISPIKEAPSPAARFPASDEGWNDAIEYAKMKK